MKNPLVVVVVFVLFCFVLFFYLGISNERISINLICKIK